MISPKQMGWKQKAKELLKHVVPTPRNLFYLLTITILTLLLPLSFFLLATLSRSQPYLQTLTLFQPFPFLFCLALQVNPCILYLLVSIVSVATLIQGLMGKITLFTEPTSSSSVLKPRLYIAWVLLCAIQVCVGLGIEGSIAAGLYDYDDNIGPGVERSLLSRVIFLLGLHETAQVWSRMVVRPVVDDTVYGVERKERWIERVGVAASLGILWWWRLREEVETVVVMAEAKKEESMDVGIVDFVGWWLYYVIVTIGMVRIVKGLMVMFMISLCRRRISTVEMESGQNDDKV